MLLIIIQVYKNSFDHPNNNLLQLNKFSAIYSVHYLAKHTVI